MASTQMQLCAAILAKLEAMEKRMDSSQQKLDYLNQKAEEVLETLEHMDGAPETITFSGTTTSAATPRPSSSSPSASSSSLVAASGKPPTPSDGAQKVFVGMPLRKMWENEQFRGFLSVRGHRIGKARRSRSSGAAGAAFASVGAALAPRPRITSSPPPLEGTPATASSTTSTDSTSSTTPVRCVRPRPGAAPASTASNRAGASHRSSACRGHDRPHKTGVPVPSAASASTRAKQARQYQEPRAMGPRSRIAPPPLEGGPTAGRAAPSPAPPPRRAPPSSSMSSSPSVVLSTEEGVIFTMSLKCSTLCLNPSDPITMPISEQRYITIRTHAYPIARLFPCLVAMVYENKGDENSVVLWSPFTYCWDLVFSRQSWPPPIQFKGTILLIGCSTVSRVFDRGKSSSDFILCTVCGVWDLLQRKPPWPPPVYLAQLWSVVFCCAFTQYKMKWLKGGFGDLLLWLDKEKVMVSMLSPFLYGTVIISTQIRLDFVLPLEAVDDLVIDTLVVADVLTAKVQLSDKYKFLTQLFNIQNIMNISMLLWGEWPDHDWYLIFGPRVNFQPYVVVIQRSQLPSSLQQKKCVRLWAEQILFQHYEFAQQESMCIRWKFSWLFLSLLAWAGDCGQQKQFHIHPYAVTWKIFHTLDRTNLSALALCIPEGFKCQVVGQFKMTFQEVLVQMVTKQFVYFRGHQIETVAAIGKSQAAVLNYYKEVAYGESDSPPKIPTNATLQVDVKLLSWTSVKDICKDGGIFKIPKEGEQWANPKDPVEVLVKYEARLEDGMGVSKSVELYSSVHYELHKAVAVLQFSDNKATGSYGMGTKTSWESFYIAGALLSQLLAVVCHHHGCARQQTYLLEFYLSSIDRQPYYSCLVLFKATWRNGFLLSLLICRSGLLPVAKRLI